MSEVITIFLILLSQLTIFCLYKLFDKKGIYYGIVLLNIITFILSFKIVLILKMNVNLGIITLITIFFLLYIFIIKYGYKEAYNILKISIISSAFMAILLGITNYFIPSTTETISINITNSIGYNYKILIAYPIINVLSEYIIIKLYRFLNSIHENNTTCIILTYIITSIVYTIVFSITSYIGVLTIKESIFIGLSSYIIGLVLTFISLIYIKIMSSKKVIK